MSLLGEVDDPSASMSQDALNVVPVDLGLHLGLRAQYSRCRLFFEVEIEFQHPPESSCQGWVGRFDFFDFGISFVMRSITKHVEGVHASDPHALLDHSLLCFPS